MSAPTSRVEGTRRLAHAQQQATSGAGFVKSSLSGLGSSLRNNALSRSRTLQKGLNDTAHSEASRRKALGTGVRRKAEFGHSNSKG